MKVRALSLFFAALLVGLPLVSFAGPTTDTDGDGIFDVLDNCIAGANASQNDTDGDLCGNFCDADFNQDGAVAIGDVTAVAGLFGTTVPPTDGKFDLSEPPDAAIAIGDVTSAAGKFGTAPGPSGTTPGTVACP